MTQHVFVPLDGSLIAEAALPHATAIARRLGARMTLARVPEAIVVPVASGGVWLTRVVESTEAHDEAQRYLETIAAHELLAGLEVALETPEYPVAGGVLATAEATGADLIVLTTHGRTGAERWVFGSVAQKLIRGAKADVYVVRAPRGHPGGIAGAGPPEFRRVVVSLDGSSLAEQALPTAASLLPADGTLLLVTVPTVPGYVKVVPETAGMIPDALLDRARDAKEYLDGIVERLATEGVAAEAGVNIVVAGGVEDGILDHARDTDAELIVMTSHGRSGLGRWLLGSVTERVVSAAQIPVWVHRTRNN